MYFLTIILGILSAWGTNTLITKYEHNTKLEMIWTQMIRVSWGVIPVMLFSVLWTVLILAIFGLTPEQINM